MVNENQETVGLVTIEDILEVVFGNIQDELDTPSDQVIPKDKKKFEIMGDITLDTFITETGQKLPPEFPPHKTFAWLCMEIKNQFPEKGDKIMIPDTYIWMTVLSVENKKAKKIAIQIREPKA